jgi:hypothetical protein
MGQRWRAVALAAAMLVSSCGTYTTPAAVQMGDGVKLVGTTSASLSSGTFEVADPASSLRCSGNYDPLDMAPTITAPVVCSDGRTGVIIVTRTADGLSGSGSVVMSDGSSGRVGFGRLAAITLVAEAAAPAAAPYEPPAMSVRPSAASCCKVCRSGKACGNSCISSSYTCRRPPGCACNG